MASFAHAGAVSCLCPKVRCAPCMMQQGLKFYSEKCGPNLSRVRSCARPTCVPDPGADRQQCPVSKDMAKAVAPTGPARGLASVASQKAVIGLVRVIKGGARIVDPQGNAHLASQNETLHEDDTLTTDSRSGVSVEFADGNEVQMQAQSRLRIKEYRPNADLQRRKAILELLKGSVRSQVHQKYKDNEQSHFRVVTPAATAGVRGTDFIVSYDDGDRVVTRVQTLKGVVHLQGRKGVDEVDVTAGRSASYVISDGEAFRTGRDWEGYLTPLSAMSLQEMLKLDRETRFDDHSAFVVGHKPQIAEANPTICHEPDGRMNQCVWRCEGDSKGAENCARARCNANGVWAEQTRIPASECENCNVHKDVVAPCDY